ncbi:putative copper-transporting ATPase [Venturia nashicola]|uniref:Putative copper-transporting ATPase n=1 Tax=Venturia nashicola TaxID=86259 RepID=A0A4Z1P4Z6_9PEZI|nr:putative copper-transporting ATPase [Venturia nashicola]TLD25786.1 putative copper-transporting ATPase [Venturia nashicola]
MPSTMAQVTPAIDGYSSLAVRMGVLPETAIFKRFGDPSARNLLYLQAELFHLRAGLLEHERVDMRDEKDKADKRARNWFTLYESCQDADDESDHWKLFLQIQKALLRAHKIASMDDPTNSDLNNLQEWLERKKRPLHGQEAGIWGTATEPTDRAPDLTALRTRQMEDPFTQLVLTTLVHPFFRIFGYRRSKHPVLGEYAYADESMRNFARFVATFFASIILIASINVLWYIPTMVGRLGAISAFNIIFSLSLMIFAKGEPIEVFSTTSAFTAVQVIFLATGVGEAK